MGPFYPADPGLRRVAFALCRSRVDAVEAKEQAARDVLAATGGVLDVDLGRPGERTVLACDGCATLGDPEFRELLAASGVAVEGARSPAFEVVPRCCTIPVGSRTDPSPV